MRVAEIPNNSVGFISQKLTEVGEKLGNKLNINHVDGFTFSIASDEIYAKSSPILITIDPVSFLILKIELSNSRSKNVWVSHFQEIKEQNISFLQITNDEGTGMKAAVNCELSDIDRQSDTFHAVAHRLGLYVERFFKSAYNLLELQTKLEHKFSNAKSEKQRQEYLNETLKIYEKTDKAIELYEYFEIIYHWLLESFQIFDEKGILKNIESGRFSRMPISSLLLKFSDYNGFC